MLKYTTVTVITSHRNVNRRLLFNENPLSVIEFGFLAAAVSLLVAERLWKKYQRWHFIMSIKLV